MFNSCMYSSCRKIRDKHNFIRYICINFNYIMKTLPPYEQPGPRFKDLWRAPYLIIIMCHAVKRWWFPILNNHRSLGLNVFWSLLFRGVNPSSSSHCFSLILLAVTTFSNLFLLITCQTNITFYAFFFCFSFVL